MMYVFIYAYVDRSKKSHVSEEKRMRKNPYSSLEYFPYIENINE